MLTNISYKGKKINHKKLSINWKDSSGNIHEGSLDDFIMSRVTDVIDEQEINW